MASSNPLLQLGQLIEDAIKQLHTVTDSPRLDCELLLCHILKKDRSFLRAWPEHELNLQQADAFQQLLTQRLQGSPVAHILGERGFWTLNLKVTPDTLIPRPDTERLVELALEIIPDKAKWNILDLGTGTGAIALSLAKEKPACHLTATDKSAAALKVAEENAKRNNISNIHFVQSDWFLGLSDNINRAMSQFEMIVSNPPYIKESDPHLKQGDVCFDPITALTSGADGLDDIRTIIKTSTEHLVKGGVLLIEHGYDQGNEVCELLKASNFTQVADFNDDNGNPRVATGYYNQMLIN
ncbi:MAG: peptide chain release factor N(5)-glutamine methyltransferase [Gammaproteobacteria bacterium]|nr:peptide chain release factor N(5)-glutamine methyltransferase [Gammaproteobacteria bacterium]